MDSSRYYFEILILCFAFAGVQATKHCVNEFKCDVDTFSAWKPGVCTSHFGGFPELQTKTQALAMHHLQASMKFLKLSTQFTYWQTERPGLQKMFEDLSDSSFNDAVQILKHMGLRGGRLQRFDVDLGDIQYQGSELEALGKALDIIRNLAEKTLSLIQIASDGSHGVPDGELAHFLADDIAERHSKEMNRLAGHVNNLANIIADARYDGADITLMISMYDSQILA